jgi:hypothetical protein
MRKLSVYVDDDVMNALEHSKGLASKSALAHDILRWALIECQGDNNTMETGK